MLALKPESTLLLVVDVQEKLAAVMPAADLARAVKNISLLVEGARLLGVPVLVTEQYPKGLGPTVQPLRDKLSTLDPKPTVLEKIEFDACQSEPFRAALRALRRPSVVVTGMESHICVYQSARSLCEDGLSVHVPADAIVSRDPENRRVALGLLERAGAIVSSTETVLFDLVGRAGSDAFKQISRMVR
jgi:nicotinamidase-related amidase